MKFLAKAGALFVGAARFTSFHEALQVPAQTRSTLVGARREIRNALRAAAQTIQLDSRYWRGQFASGAAKSRPQIVPKFSTQGSFAYDLLVDPWHFPPQQVDLDDGIYFNVDFLENGEPALVAKMLYSFVETALEPLRVARGWVIVEKDCCVRIQVDSSCHIDLPIYSAPRQVVESITAFDSRTGAVLAKRSGQKLSRLPSDKIMLAYRDGTWQRSDPLLLQDWVDGCVARYGQDFRRACRYLKGWRDLTWPTDGLTSITIMAAVDKALDALNGSHRALPDDHLLFEIAQRLPGILRSDLCNPAFPQQNMRLNDWSDDVREDILCKAEKLAAELHSALKGTYDSTIVVESLRRALGTRIPFRPDAVEMLPTIAATVIAERPARVPSPQVSKSTSG
jgi:hypothetical protein